MLLRRLMECLLQFGVVAVMTSKYAYTSNFLVARSDFVTLQSTPRRLVQERYPARELCAMHRLTQGAVRRCRPWRWCRYAAAFFPIVSLNVWPDYRRVPRALSHVYFFPLSDANRREIDKIFEALTSEHEDLPIRNRPLRIWGRDLIIPESTSTVARFSFNQLCGQPLSAADYLEVTRTFRTVFVTDVPKMGLNQKDMARRFITFIDGESV